MKKKFFLSVVMLFTLLFSGMSQAFIPEAEHLLYLVIKKIKQPVGIEAWQTRKILNYQTPDQGLIEFEEKLLYSYPNQLRTQIVSQSMESFSVESDYEFIKISDGIISSQEKSLVDMYSDILLYRDHETLLNQLDLKGIDTTQVSFQRYSDTICWVIGKHHKPNQETNSDFPGLWIEKDTFLPLRYIIKKNDKKVEFFYQNWHKVSKTFYPMQVYIFLDNRLYATIDVKTFYLKSGFLPDLFDIENIESLYPKQTPADDKEVKKNSDEEGFINKMKTYINNFQTREE